MSMRAILTLIPALALAGCVAGPPPEIATPVPALPDTFLYHPGAEEGAALADLLPHHDPAFRALADRAIAEAPSLAEALARVEAARAGADRAGAERLPNVGSDASVEFRRSNPSQFGGSLPAAIPIDTEQTGYAANLTARWDPDLFGVLKASERAALARLDAADASAQAVRIALLAEIAASVIDWRTLEQRQAALAEDLAAAERLAELTSDRVDAGLLPGFNSLRVEANASQSRTRIAALASDRARLVGRLVTLTGQPAQEITALLSQPSEAGNSPAVPIALPSTILVNRPDVQAASAQLLAADADLAATARQRFPRLTLSAALGLLSFDLSELFDNDSVVGSVAGGIAAPLLDFGRIQAEIDGAAANKRAAFAAYRGAVFTALGDTEAAYGLVNASDRELHAAREENAKLKRVADLAETRFRAGLENSLTFFEARRNADTSGERAAAAHGRARRARVILWQALGGSPALNPAPGPEANSSQ